MELFPKEPELVGHLAAHRLFHSNDLDETRDTVGRIFKPHELGVRGRRQKLDAEMDHLSLGKASINRLRYGADVTIEPESLDDFLLVQMPMSGRADIRCGAEHIVSTPDMASVLTPSLPVHMQWQGVCDQLIVKIERHALETACAAALGHALPCPIEFKLGMDLSRDGGLAWRQLIAFLTTSQFIAGADQRNLVTSQLEQLLATTLLTRHPHNYSAALLNPAPTPDLPYIRRAEEYILAHCKEPITMQDLARHAHISTRSLYKGFQEHRGISPMGYVRQVRLQKVRDALLQARRAGQSISVTQVALDWGFGHLGHFTQAYRKQFNELPSQTLRG
ncbi:AraC family transcriptional regulator [Pusillimonas minor]|uniref:AraC family transcriptional regulator n=1 Tax=Pusillimonas minor TaxID=2697024 RepID=A0A842HLX9_9BURK|nr:AraC family transcriptional regulator [Pusillimonas minor]MBC2769809.1 AraC family transcriptional regulator [Pusillimonas minor]